MQKRLHETVFLVGCVLGFKTHYFPTHPLLREMAGSDNSSFRDFLASLTISSKAKVFIRKNFSFGKVKSVLFF